MSNKDFVPIRKRRRYNHVVIKLRIKIHNDWVWIKAHDWNEIGFNFFRNHNINDSVVEFKKGQTIFTGEIVWSRSNDNDNVYLEIVVNKLLYNKSEQMEKNNPSAPSRIKLIRTEGRLEDKLKLLPDLGVNITKHKLSSLVEEYKNECLIHRYGVKVDSPEWANIVKQVIKSGS